MMTTARNFLIKHGPEGFLGLLILVIIAGIFYLIDYLNKSGDNGNSNVKPKSLTKTRRYEKKIKGKKTIRNKIEQGFTCQCS